jgi:hypothetical protein
MDILNNSVPELAEHGDTDTSIAAPTMGPPSYTSCIAHTTPTSNGNVLEVAVTNPSESGSREREKLQRRLDTLRSTGQYTGEEMQDRMDSLRRRGPDPGHLAPPITRRRSTRTTSDSLQRDNGLLTNPNTTPSGDIDSSGMYNLRGDQNNQTLQPESNQRRMRFDDNVNTRNITASDTATLVRQRENFVNNFVAETLTPVRQNAPTNISYIPNYRDRSIVGLDDFHPRRTNDNPLAHSHDCPNQTASGASQGAQRLLITTIHGNCFGSFKHCSCSTRRRFTRECFFHNKPRKTG